jgi:hypothetical protein
VRRRKRWRKLSPYRLFRGRYIYWWKHNSFYLFSKFPEVCLRKYNGSFANKFYLYA